MENKEYLRVSGIRKSFGNTHVLKGIDFNLNKGEILTVIGSSGSGKTTLLRCLNFLELADEGTISIGGEVIFDGSALKEKKKKLKDAELRQKRLRFGLVFQSFNLFPQYTVLQNVMLAPKLHKKGTPEEIEQRAKELIERVGLGDKMNNYPCQLSGGQQQRVSIARAMLRNPKMLVFDEATAAVDSETERLIQDAIENMITGRTTLMIAHRLSTLAKANKIIVVDNGHILEFGSPQELMEKKGKYYKLVQIQSMSDQIAESRRAERL
jgi:polar amino acid transport system ATP-binding protein